MLITKTHQSRWLNAINNQKISHLVLSTLRDGASHTADNALGWANIGIPSTGEGVDAAIDTEAGNWAAGGGDV